MGKPTTKNTLSSKALVHIRQRNQKFYRQAKAERIQHHQTSLTTNANGTSLHRKEKATVDFPDGAVVKNPPANAGDTSSMPGPGRSHMLWSN